jgi:hypothetical protein
MQHSARRGAMGAVATALIVVLSAAAGHTARSEGTAGPPSSDLAELSRVAHAMIEDNGDRPFTAIQGVETTEQTANAYLMQARVLTDQPVYAVQVVGDFIAYAAKPPPGQPVPTGHVLVFTYDAGAHAILDWGVNEQPQDLSQLGPPFAVP